MERREETWWAIPYLIAFFCLYAPLLAAYWAAHWDGFFLVYAVESVLCGLVAFSRRQSFWIGFVVSLFTTPFVGFLLVKQIRNSGRSRAQAAASGVRPPSARSARPPAPGR